MNNRTALEVQGLYHHFDTTTVLENVCFQVDKGEFVGIFGPNGGGKTTLLHLLMGFQKPAQGQILVFGKSPKEIRPNIGYVPQINRLDKHFPITVLEIVLMGCLSSANLFGKLPTSAKQKAMEALKKVGLYDKKESPFGSLSGGQAQRVLIARAIVNQPDLLILDEPTASVDPQAEKDILQILQDLKGDTTILMVTHDLQTIINQVGKLLCVHRQVHTLLPNEVCEHFGLGLYHSPITPTTPIGARR